MSLVNSGTDGLHAGSHCSLTGERFMVRERTTAIHFAVVLSSVMYVVLFPVSFKSALEEVYETVY